MSDIWNTKWGARRVRHDPPTLAEALAAAQGFTNDPEGQAEIAAGLMGTTLADAKAELRRLAPERRATATVLAPFHKRTGLRTVVIERKTSRRSLLPMLRTREIASPR